MLNIIETKKQLEDFKLNENLKTVTLILSKQMRISIQTSTP